MCGEHWSSGAGRRFAALVSGRVLLIKVFSVVHSVLHVDVYLSSGPQDVANVRDVLISEGHAELAEECYESRVHGAWGGGGGGGGGSVSLRRWWWLGRDCWFPARKLFPPLRWKLDVKMFSVWGGLFNAFSASSPRCG